MKIIFKDKFFLFLSLFFIVCSSFYFGYKYSFFNTDIHHYSIILEAYHDSLNGYKVNKDIFILYGNAQIYLYNFLSNIFDINLVTIGIINQFFFSLKFVLFFIILKFFVNNFFSIFGTFMYYFLYTFTQTATSDVLASFCIHLFILSYLYNLKTKNLFFIFITAFVLFLSIYFRHSYILNIAILMPLMFFLNLFLKDKYIYEIKILKTFLLILTFFFIILFFQDRLILWFDQSIGIGITKYLSLNFSSEANFVDTIYKLLYYFARVIRHIVIPNSFGSSYFFSIIIVFNFLFLVRALFQDLFTNNKLNNSEKNLFFLSLLAFSGSIQLINKFETSRYINVSFPFIIIFVYLISNYLKKFNNKLHKISILTVLIIIFIPVTLKYPFYSNFYNFKLDKTNDETSFKFNNKFYSEINKPFFGKKKLNEEFINFYNNINNEICNFDIIYNLSFDRSFHFLCKNQKKYTPSLYFKYLNNQFAIKDFEDIKENKKILISHDVFNNLELVNTYRLPKYYSYTKSDIFFKFFPEKIYLYR